MSLRSSMIALAALTALGACQANSVEEGGDEPSEVEASPTPDSDATVSILRPEVNGGELPEGPLEALKVTVGFPAGGTELDEEALEALESIMQSEQIALEGPIRLSGHTDSAGDDRANLRAGRSRAEAVRDWLIGRGVAADRIEVITFGEQNPVEPNALPDGNPNEPGRAANRRVEVEIPVVVLAEGEAAQDAGSAPNAAE